MTNIIAATKRHFDYYVHSLKLNPKDARFIRADHDVCGVARGEEFLAVGPFADSDAAVKAYRVAKSLGHPVRTVWL